MANKWMRAQMAAEGSPVPATAEVERPWHGAESPLEALFQHFTEELARLRGGSQPSAPPAEPPSAT